MDPDWEPESTCHKGLFTDLQQNAGQCLQMHCFIYIIHLISRLSFPLSLSLFLSPSFSLHKLYLHDFPFYYSLLLSANFCDRTGKSLSLSLKPSSTQCACKYLATVFDDCPGSICQWSKALKGKPGESATYFGLCVRLCQIEAKHIKQQRQKWLTLSGHCSALFYIITLRVL